jgi:DNA polymerase
MTDGPGRIARQIRQRIEMDRLLGWDPPLSRRGMKSPAKPRPAGREPERDAERVPGRKDPAPGTKDERQAGLDVIRTEVEACTRCDLCRTRTRTVFGVGDPEARILFVGEAPGADEDRQGEPFVGRAGRLLNDIIKAMGLGREQVYIANVVKCRPPENRVPNPGEAGSCIGYLERQIDIISPEVIVTLGSVATKALLGVESSMGALRGRFHAYRGIPLMPTYHPAYLLRNPSEKRKVWEDIQKVMERLGMKRPLASGG